jgi:serine/threonine protein kinase
MRQNHFTPEEIEKIQKFDSLSTLSGGCSSIPKIEWSDILLVSVLGKGSFSFVFCVSTKLPEQTETLQYALKCINTKLQPADFVTAASDLAHEADMLSRLDHPNIIQLKGVSSSKLSHSYQQEGSGYFLLLPVLKDTLQDRLNQWRVEEKRYSFLSSRLMVNRRTESMLIRARTVGLGIAQGMEYLQSQQIILRDLKPANIGFDSASGTLKLFDFGFARHITDEGLKKEIAGSYRYMAPENFRGNCDLFSDVYSFALVLWEICTLGVPFGGIRNLKEFNQKVVVSHMRPPLRSIPASGINSKGGSKMRLLVAACWDPLALNRPTFSQVCECLTQETVIKKRPARSTRPLKLYKTICRRMVLRKKLQKFSRVTSHGSDSEESLVEFVYPCESSRDRHGSDLEEIPAVEFVVHHPCES